MGRINHARVILGGLAAGLILNLGEIILNTQIVAGDWEAAMKALNKPPAGSQAILVFVVLMFILGILATWLYAAIRPRFGPGPRTAICAALGVWAFAYAWPSFGAMPMGVFPAKLFVISMAWGLLELPVAVLVGAWLYREA